MPNFLNTPIGEPDYLPDSSWLEHGPFAMWLVRRIDPRRIVELGTHHGYSYFSMCQAVQEAKLATRCHAVDTWHGDDHTQGYGEEVFQRVELENKRYSGFSALSRKLFSEALPEFEDGSIDLLHIDGRHYYDDVKTDFESWLPKLSARGIVLLHDTEVYERNFGVHKFFAEVSARYPTFNFLHGSGLGVVFVGPEVPAGAEDLLRLISTPEGTQFARDYFALAGSRVHDRGAMQHWQAENARLEGQLGQTLQESKQLEERLAGQATEVARLEAALADDSAALTLEKTTLARETALLAEQSAERDRLMTTMRQLAERASLAEAQRDEAERRAQELSQAANQLALKAAKAERHPFSTVLRRLGYGIAKGLAAAPGVRDTSFGSASRRFSEKHSPKRHYRLLTGPAAAPEGAYCVAEGAVEPALRGRHYLTFDPAPVEGKDLTADQKGTYRVTSLAPGYTYLSPRRPDDMETRIAALKTKPRFSIIMPTYNTPPDLLEAALASVRAQWYAEWEVVIADDASPDPAVRDALRAIDDPRIHILWQKDNGGISVATNAALAEASGDYVVFLDHDDELTPDCLWELARTIDETGADFVYSDEDKIDEAGRFVQPFFKPDWSPETMMSTMYTCHVSCVRRSLLQSVGPLRPEFDGAQDWDLILRVTEQAQKIAHIPRVLYHWRIIPSSISGDLQAKPAAIERARALREEALARRGHRGSLEVLPEFPQHHRVNYRPQGNPQLSIVIPTRNNGPVLETCLNSLMQPGVWKNTEIIVIDNGSDEAKTLSILSKAERAGVRLLQHPHPFNYSELNNLGIGASSGEVMLFLNDDTELVNADALERMIGFAQLPHIGVVGAKLLYPGGTQVQHAGLLNLRSGPGHAFIRTEQSEPGYFLRNHLEYNWLAVTGACLMIERKKLEALGNWDETFPVAYNDVELCFRAHKAGYFNVVCQAARLIHHESMSRGMDHQSVERTVRLNADRLRLYEKHPDLLMRDPFHNPNLQFDGVNFDLPGAA